MAPANLEIHRLAKLVRRHLAFLLEGDRALLALPISRARELFFTHTLTHQRAELLEALPLLEKPQQDYVITLLCMKP